MQLLAHIKVCLQAPHIRLGVSRQFPFEKVELAHTLYYVRLKSWPVSEVLASGLGTGNLAT